MIDIFGLIGALLVTIAIVAVVEMVSRTKLPYGWLGNIIVGFIGGVIGQYILGQRFINLCGVYIIETFLGSLIFILVAKWIMGMLAKSRS